MSDDNAAYAPDHPESWVGFLPEPEEDYCECCGEVIPRGEERSLIYGAVWCSSCADDPDQYDSEEDYRQEQRDRP
jgi:hypothetical protein